MPSYSQDLKDWIGEYTFDEDGGKTAGGTRIFISHELSIVESDDGLLAYLKSNGYQTSVDLICKVKGDGSKITLYFDEYGEDNVFESYEPGDLLLTLEKKTVKGKPQVLTYWEKFTASVPANERPGRVYFVRSSASPKQ